MSNLQTTTNGCTLIGDFIENANADEQLVASVGEAVPPILIGDFVETSTVISREFIVLLRDQRTVNVTGRELKYFDESDVSQEGTYAVIGSDNDQTMLIALFPASQVVGVFCGKLELPEATRNRSTRKSKRRVPAAIEEIAKPSRGVVKVKPRSRKP